MTRDEFLAKSWRRYPEAKAGWKDLSSFLSEPKAGAVVCGRLRSRGDVFDLEFGDRKIEIAFDSAEWLEPQMNTASRPTTALFSDGDLVAARASAISGVRLECDRILLLVPSLRASSADPGFGVTRSIEWMKFLETVRAYFSRDFIEVSTPTLVPSPGTEPFLDPFETTWEMGSQKRKFYLPTSPEFHLKKLLASGWARVFEIKTCFRNGEVGSHHQPEFHMLEWYRAFANLDAIAEDVENLFEAVARAFGAKLPSVHRTSMAKLFAEAFPGFVLRPETTVVELRDLAKTHSIGISDDDDFDDLFHRLFLERIEPELEKKGIVIVRGYPPSQAALSRIGADGFADRFEVYWRGLEIANAFHELNDPKANVARFEDDAIKKIALRKSPVPRDEDLVRAIEHGLPPSGGIALGLDRFFMAIRDIEDISATRAFPIKQE